MKYIGAIVLVLIVVTFAVLAINSFLTLAAHGGL